MPFSIKIARKALRPAEHWWHFLGLNENLRRDIQKRVFRKDETSATASHMGKTD